VVAQTGFIGTSAYAASKAGLYGFTKSVSKEVANKNITVNTMSYGYMNAGMIDVLTEDLQAEILAQIPRKQFGPIESIAKTITFLASEEASYITGQNIPINGGLA
jgi:NAD(P)-dependent dehydrogenase (short-subunit alcohol dehydrogenase family)